MNNEQIKILSDALEKCIKDINETFDKHNKEFKKDMEEIFAEQNKFFEEIKNTWKHD